MLEEFLSLDVPLVNASAALAGFADAAGLKLGNALARFNGRVAALSNAGVDLSCLDYRAAFGRPLDYYTGLVFEVTVEGSTAVLAKRRPLRSAPDFPRRNGPHSGRRLLLLARPYRNRKGSRMTITIALPSKGRMKEDASAIFERASA